MADYFLILDQSEWIHGPFDQQQLIAFLDSLESLEKLEICFPRKSWQQLSKLDFSPKNTEYQPIYSYIKKRQNLNKQPKEDFISSTIPKLIEKRKNLKTNKSLFVLLLMIAAFFLGLIFYKN